MKKRIFTICAVMLLALAFSVTALADDLKGESGWQVTFDGSKMDSNFSSSKIDEQLNRVEPGDSIELTIKLVNNYNGQADWYMKNEVLETLEATDDIAGAGYDYTLIYTDKDGQATTLFSSRKFGGDGRYNGVGLKGATTTLDDYFYLDRMGNGDDGTITLNVKLDGPGTRNVYQNTLARLQMDFATELVSEGNGDGNANTSTNGRGTVRTGDQSKILLYTVLTLAAGLVLLVIAVKRLREEREEAAVTVNETQRRTAARRRRR